MGARIIGIDAPTFRTAFCRLAGLDLTSGDISLKEFAGLPQGTIVNAPQGEIPKSFRKDTGSESGGMFFEASRH
jgi:hypothetical protein